MVKPIELRFNMRTATKAALLIAVITIVLSIKQSNIELTILALANITFSIISCKLTSR